jgi:hypothetical protein
VPYLSYEMSVFDADRNAPQAAVATGGAVLICTAGTTDKATLYNPASDFASLSNPVSFSRGKIRFATLDSVTSVDIYGFAPTGQFLVRRGVKPGAEGEFVIDTTQMEQVAHIPFHWSDYTAASEVDTGLDLPAGSVLVPGAHVRVTTADSGITLEAGVLSSESGGDADGFFDAVSLASAASVAPTLSGATPTLGALLRTDFATTPVLAVPRPYPVASAVSVTITGSSGWDTAAGFLVIPYVLQPL